MQHQPSQTRSGSRRRYLPLIFGAILVAFLAGCYSFGRETTWLRIQNMSTQPASFSVQFFGLDGRPLAQQVCPSSACPALAPAAGWTISSEHIPGVPSGFLGSAIVSSDQPLAILQASDVEREEDQFQSSGDTLASVPVSGPLFLPIMVRQDGPQADWNGRLLLQNVSPTVLACVTLVYSRNGADGPVFWDPYHPARPPTRRDPACPNGGFPLPAGASAYREVVTLGVDAPFTGSVRVELYTNAQGVPPLFQSVVASAGIWNEHSLDFGSYQALREADLGTTVLLPLIERRAGGEWSTDFAIQNQDPSRPATVTLRIDGMANGAPVSKQHTFTVRASRVCFQDLPAADCLAPGDDLPVGFHGGRAVLTSDRPIGVVAARSSASQEAYTNYRGLAVGQASRGVFLPLVSKHAVGAGRTGANSWVRVQVANGGTATVTVAYFGPGLPGGAAASMATISGAGNIVQASESVLPNGFTGSAVLISDAPIVAVVNVQTGSFDGDMDLMYTGIPSL